MMLEHYSQTKNLLVSYSTKPSASSEQDIVTMERPTVAPSVITTPAALSAIAELVEDRGPIMFFQSGGCWDGSLPICLPTGSSSSADHDVLVGHVGGCPFYIDHCQYEAWKHTQLIPRSAMTTRKGSRLPPVRTSTSSSGRGVVQRRRSRSSRS